MTIPVYGRTMDGQTRCTHYFGPTDVIAIKFRCCLLYYPCYECHRECAGHEATRWPVDEWHSRAILCGVCQSELTIEDYLNVSACPSCNARFNDGCRLHRHLYFATTR